VSIELSRTFDTDALFAFGALAAIRGVLLGALCYTCEVTIEGLDHQMKLHELRCLGLYFLSIKDSNEGARLADPSQGRVDQVIEIIAV
jgi:hypothetical protein